MPSEQDHRKQEARNWAFYRAELGGRNAAYCEWAVTVIFYAAVHKVEAFLRRNNVPASGSHRDRKASLRGLKRFRAIATLEKLETASPVAKRATAAKQASLHRIWISSKSGRIST